MLTLRSRHSGRLLRPRNVAIGATGVVLLVGLATGAYLVRRPANHPGESRSVDLEAKLVSYAGALDAGAPFRKPTRAEQQTAVRGITTVLDHRTDRQRYRQAAGALAGLGFTAAGQTDSGTGRRYAIFSTPPGTERGWGVVVIDLSAPARLVVEVPHPNFDLHTERPGVALFRQVPGSILLMAGAYRKIDRSAADVAHQPDTVFNALATELAHRRLPQVQLHGFADQNLPGHDLVLSTGTDNDTGAATTGPAQRVADRLAGSGLRVCRAWRQTCGHLEGTTNVQGQTAHQVGTFFLHVEMNRTVRDRRRNWTAVVSALAESGIQGG